MAFGNFGGGNKPSLFGQSAPAFGASSSFGAASGAGLFGRPAQQTPFGGGGAFGQSAASPFGGGGAFGQSAAATPFGGGGGGGGAFGQPASTPFGGTATSGSAFGQPSTSTPFGGGGAFGQPSASPFGGVGAGGAGGGTGFGQPASTPFGAGGAFGGSAATPFGGGGGAAGGFGQPSATPFGGGATSGFGGGSSGFGASAATPFGGASSTPFGGSAGFAGQQPLQAGTRSFPYQETTLPDSSDKYVSISAMQQFAGHSTEELRLQDYNSNDKGGPSSNPQPSTGIFGAAAPVGQQTSAGLFGAPQTPFGQQTTGGLFGGASTAGLFGQPSSGFGAPAQSSGGLFGAPQPSNTPFGGGGGVATGAVGAFGAGAANPMSGFGQPTSGAGIFGQPAAQPTGLFGATPTPSGFGLGATSAPAQSSSLFGAPASTNLFGAPASSAATWGASTPFGSNPSAGSGFGTSTGAASGSSLFGAPSTGTGLFASSPSAFGGSNFGAASGTGLFGGNMFGTGSGGFGAAGAPLMGAQPVPLQHAQPSISSNPFGDSGLFAHVSEALKKEKAELMPIANGAAPQSAPTVVVGQIRGSFNSRTAVKRPPGAYAAARRALGADLFQKPVPGVDVFHVGTSQARFAESGRRTRASHLVPWRTPAQAARARNIKRLVIEPLKESVSESSSAAPETATASVRFEKGTPVMPPPSQPATTPRPGEVAGENASEERHDVGVERPTPRFLVGQSVDRNGTAAVYETYGEYHKANSAGMSPRRRRSEERVARRERELANSEAVPPFTKRPDISTRPTLDRLQQKNALELTRVPDFAVIRQGIGEIEWEGETDVTGLDIDRAVELRFREIRVYPNEEDVPPVGTGLNKPAVVKLHGIWKKNKRTNSPMKDENAAASMVQKLETHCKKEGLEFISYDVKDGTWTFGAKRF